MCTCVQASLACVVTGPPRIDDVNKIRSKDGKELVSQGRNLSFFQQKALRVRRLYDEKRSAVVYVAYSTRLTSAQDEGGASTGRYKCAPLHDPPLSVVLSMGAKPGAWGFNSVLCTGRLAVRSVWLLTGEVQQLTQSSACAGRPCALCPSLTLPR